MSKKQVNQTILSEKKNGKRKILLISLLVILVPIIVFFSYRFIQNKLEDANVKKMNNTINELSKDRTDYVFVEINPSLVMTIKDNKVSDIACLNDDCMSIYNDINVKGKTINESIDIVYNVSKNKGFDTSNGVKVKTTGNVNIENKDNITVEYINETTKNELLLDVKNNENIKDNNNDDYYTNLWNELKKDDSYDKVYTCNMDNKELECYFTSEFLNKGPKVNGNDIDYGCNSESECEKLENSISKDVLNTFKRFGIKTDKNTVSIDNIDYSYEMVDEPYVNVLSNSTSEMVPVPQKLCDNAYIMPSKNGKCELENVTIYRIPLDKFNLLRPNASLENQIIETIDNSDVIEKALEQYEKN